MTTNADRESRDDDNVVELQAKPPSPHGSMPTQGMKPREKELHDRFVAQSRQVFGSNDWQNFEAALRQVFAKMPALPPDSADRKP